MALPAPDLDDRRFQDFVDDAKRLVQERCPEWTDHNVSDPGVTLIEAFATMADQLAYRLNRVPERLHLKFLDLVGIRLFPPTAARVPVSFWLSAPQPDVVRIPAGTVVATRRSTGAEVQSFSTTDDLDVVPVSLQTVATHPLGGDLHAQSELELGQAVRVFSPHPGIGDLLLFGLDSAAPSCAVAFRLDCAVEGIGVDPRQPPLVWEAWTGDEGEGWSRCAVERDDTGGFNRAGDVVVHLPPRHRTSVLNGVRAGWVRARVVEPLPGRPAYTASPTVRRASAFCIGGTVEAVHAELVREEVVGVSEGLAAQRFFTVHAPVLPSDEGVVLEISEGDGWQEWKQVDSFAGSAHDDLHFVLHPMTGEVELGPQVRLPDGSVQQYAAVPARGAVLRLRAYRTGGGAAGNVRAHALAVLRSSIPYVSRVDNRVPASGGRDGEDLENAKRRGGLQVRSQGRAVTAEDYEHVARVAAPEVGRVRAACDDDGIIRVLVVPSLAVRTERVAFDALVPAEATLRRIAAALDERRVLGAQVVVEPPVYQGVTVVARILARPGRRALEVRDAALRALYGYLSPVTGGPDGTGWPFGRSVGSGEIYAALQQMPEVDVVEDVRLFAADAVSGARSEPSGRIQVAPTALVFSYDHQVKVTTCED